MSLTEISSEFVHGNFWNIGLVYRHKQNSVDDSCGIQFLLASSRCVWEEARLIGLELRPKRGMFHGVAKKT